MRNKILQNFPDLYCVCEILIFLYSFFLLIPILIHNSLVRCFDEDEGVMESGQFSLVFRLILVDIWPLSLSLSSSLSLSLSLSLSYSLSVNLPRKADRPLLSI